MFNFLSSTEAHEVSHDLADLPGGLLMKQRLEERVASMAVGAATGRAARPASGKLVDELLKQAGTVAAGAFGEAAAGRAGCADAAVLAAAGDGWTAAATQLAHARCPSAHARCPPVPVPATPASADLASAVAAAVGAGDEDGAAAAPTPPPPKMLETRSHEVDVAVPDPSAPQPQMQPMPDPAPATPAAPAQPAQPAERQKVDALGSTTQPKPKPKDPKSSGARAPAAPAAKPPAAKPPTTPATKTPAAPASKAPAAPASKAPATPAAKAPAPPSPPKAPKAPTYDAFPAEPWKGYTLPPYELKEPRVVGLADLKPTIGAKRGHKYYYQVGVLLGGLSSHAWAGGSWAGRSERFRCVALRVACEGAPGAGRHAVSGRSLGGAAERRARARALPPPLTPARLAPRPPADP